MISGTGDPGKVAVMETAPELCLNTSAKASSRNPCGLLLWYLSMPTYCLRGGATSLYETRLFYTHEENIF